MDVSAIAKLSNFSLSDKKKQKLSQQFEEVLKLVSKIQDLDLEDVEGTTHVSKVKNVFREDEVDESRILTQEEALSGAKKTYNGYFVVDAILNSDD